MKITCCVLILALAIGANAAPSDAKKAQMMEIGKKCGAEYGITEEMVGNFMKGDRSAVNDKTKCVAKCFLEGIGVIDPSGKIIEATVQEFIKEDPSIEPQLMECGKIEHADPCEKSFQMLGCVMKLCKDHK